MKITFKKLGCVLLVLCMMCSLLLTSCGDDDASSGGDSQEAARNEFINGIGGVSETYEGTVSKESYETAEDAAIAYVEVEVAGESDADVESVEAVGELTSSEISNEIPKSLQEGITAVEKYEVTYSLSEGYMSYASTGKMQVQQLASDTLNKTKKVTVYVIKYENNWKYFTPMPVTGETISKSYYDSVFDYEKYKNCTYKYELGYSYDIDVSAQGMSQSMKMDMTVTQLIKHADNKVYLEQKIEVDGTGMGLEDVGDEFSNMNIYAYLEEVDGEVVCYVKQGDSTEWYETNLYTIGFGDLEELTPFYDQYLDYTYFTKTEYGFALEEENAKEYVSQIFEELGSMMDGMDMDIDMFAEYYVSEGVLSGMRMDMDMNMNMDMYGTSMTMTGTGNGLMTCTDYGTTVVEKPFTE